MYLKFFFPSNTSHCMQILQLLCYQNYFKQCYDIVHFYTCVIGTLGFGGVPHYIETLFEKINNPFHDGIVLKWKIKKSYFSAIEKNSLSANRKSFARIQA